LSNCHVFSTECVSHAVARPKDNGVLDKLWQTASGLNLFNETWEPTLTLLKLSARENLGATKWRLWDWEDNAEDNPTPEPDWEAQQDALRRMPLTAEAIQALQHEREEQQAYYQEISDESIPDDIRRKLNDYGVLLEEIIDVYNGAKSFLAACPGASFSYEDLKRNQADLMPLANQMQGNAQIKELVRKMGRAYISEEKKAMSRVPQASRSEVHGTHRSDDLMRLLPSELVNLDDETLEHLFYARLLEKNLLSYELSGTTFIQQEVTEQVDQKITGPVVACLDTSGSMNGEPELKAKALLLAISGILQTEKRNLHVILFGSSGELKEFTVEQKNDAAGLLAFLQQGFGGGTDFETPLQRACEHIQQYDDYLKADVLMISDGDCQLSQDYLSQLQQQKQQLDFSIYSVLCNGQRVDDSFSDEIVVL
ncbi:MAG: VWA domain-containing protein, partial [Plesiomonas shigelloides]